MTLAEAPVNGGSAGNFGERGVGWNRVLVFILVVDAWIVVVIVMIVKLLMFEG